MNETPHAALTLDEQAKVAQACLKHGNLVLSISRQFLRPGFEIEDLTQIGYGGLVDAVRDWKEDGGSSFVTIANLRIRDSLRSATAFRKDMHRIAISFDSGLEEGEDSFHDLVGEEPTQEITFERKESIDTVRRALDAVSDEDRTLLQAWQEANKDSSLRPRSHSGGERRLCRASDMPRTTLQRRIGKAQANLREAFRQTPAAVKKVA